MLFFFIGLAIGVTVIGIIFYLISKKTKEVHQDQLKILQRHSDALKKKLQNLKEEEEDVKKTKSFHDLNSALKYLDDVLRKLK